MFFSVRSQLELLGERIHRQKERETGASERKRGKEGTLGTHFTVSKCNIVCLALCGDGGEDNSITVSPPTQGLIACLFVCVSERTTPPVFPKEKGLSSPGSGIEGASMISLWRGQGMARWAFCWLLLALWRFTAACPESCTCTNSRISCIDEDRGIVAFPLLPSEYKMEDITEM